MINHPVVADKVRRLRDKTTENADFLRIAGEITRFVAYEAFRDAPTTAATVDTPVVDGAPATRLDAEFVIVPILRAGLGMVPSVQEVLTRNRVCLVGLRRDEETLQPHVYLDGLPREMSGEPVVICDPMLATGGSIDCVVEMLRARGAGAVTVLCLIAAKPGVDLVFERHPEITVVAAALDSELNSVGYISPGLGDAGDRLFGPPAH